MDTRVSTTRCSGSAATASAGATAVVATGMLDEHWGYVADPARVERFERAVRSVVKPGDLVADLACGSGILGLLCLRAGASHVYAVDHGPMLEVARETMARNGVEKNFSFIPGRSQSIRLPQRVDVIVCDNVGWFGFDYDIIPFLADARRRFLKPGGIAIPASITLRVAAVSSERCKSLAERWRADEVPAEYRWLRERAVNTKHSIELQPEDLVSGGADLAVIDLCAEGPDFVAWRATLTAKREAAVHGLGGWFDCELVPGIRMTNSPEGGQRINRPQVLLPIDAAVEVRVGDPIEVTIMARSAENLLAWSVSFPRAERRFSHSTWQGMALSARSLAQSNPDRVPQPSETGRARGVVLGYCDGKRTLREIELAVLRDHPTLLPSAAEISRFVVEVLAKDTR